MSVSLYGRAVLEHASDLLQKIELMPRFWHSEQVNLRCPARRGKSVDGLAAGAPADRSAVEHAPGSPQPPHGIAADMSS